MSARQVASLAVAIHPPTSERKLMLMLTAYFDESGHPDDPDLSFVGMAGFVAPYLAWQGLEESWAAILHDAGLSEPFHMKEFAHSTGQFTEWRGKEPERRRLFGALIEVILATKATPIGAVVSLREFETLTVDQKGYFLNPYYLAFQQCTRGAAIEGVFEDPAEKVAMVYAYQDEFGTNRGGNAEQLWHAIKKETDFGSRMGAYASSTPDELCALQAADVFAYELAHDFELRIKRPDLPVRWGLKQIIRMCSDPLPMMMFFDRMELLRMIRENKWPDQAGVNEVTYDAKQTAQENLIKWAIDRAEWSDEL